MRVPANYGNANATFSHQRALSLSFFSFFLHVIINEIDIIHRDAPSRKFLIKFHAAASSRLKMKRIVVATLQINYAVSDEDQHHWKAGRETIERTDVVFQSFWYVSVVKQQRGDPGTSCT